MPYQIIIMMFLGLSSIIHIITPVQAQTRSVMLLPIEDAYTDGNFPDENYGSESNLMVGGCNWAFLKFNISAIPQDAYGITAFLGLMTRNVPTPHLVVARFILDNSWTEDTITALNQPSGLSIQNLDSICVASRSTWYEWDVTKAVDDAFSKNVEIITFSMRYPCSFSDSSIIFASRESGRKTPKLWVYWTGIIPEFPSIAIFAPIMIASLVTTILVKKEL